MANALIHSAQFGQRFDSGSRARFGIGMTSEFYTSNTLKRLAKNVLQLCLKLSDSHQS
jgi:hypothetical protein